jgi:hypothetical protein
MVLVFVGEQHRRDRGRLDADVAHAPLELTAREPGVDEDPRAARFDDNGIPPASGAQNRGPQRGKKDWGILED